MKTQEIPSNQIYDHCLVNCLMHFAGPIPENILSIVSDYFEQEKKTAENLNVKVQSVHHNLDHDTFIVNYSIID